MRSQFHFDPGPDGKLQMVIPGAEQRPNDLIRMMAAAPMRSSKPQQACDVGLFDETQTQIDLVDMLGNEADI